MFEAYKNRMEARGQNMSEMLRMQSNMIVEQTWDRDPNARKVYVVKVDSGLPKIIRGHEMLDIKFNVRTYANIKSDEPSYSVQFRHGEEKRHPEIGVGSYIYMQNEDGEWQWWLMVHLDDRPMFRRYQILECNYTIKWVADGKIYNTLGVQRIQQSYNSGSWDGDRLTFVDNVTSVIVPTNSDTITIGYNKRFIISDPKRYPPLVYQVSKIEDTQPIGLTTLKFTQETFDPTHDNAELMICNYYDTEITPVESITKPAPLTFNITYNGKNPAVKVGGSAKTFTAQLPEDDNSDIKWSLSDGVNIYGGLYDNYTEVFGDYTITTTDRTMKLKVASNYDLVGTVLTIQAECADGNTSEIQVEVIG